ALDLAAAGGVGELLGRLGDHGVAVVVEPVDERPDRRGLLVLDQGGIGEGANQMALFGKELQKPLVVDVETGGGPGGIQVGAVNEQRDAFFWIKAEHQSLNIVLQL